MTDDIEERRAIERARYERIYADRKTNYRMAINRYSDMHDALMAIPLPHQTFLDVGCGMGRLMHLADRCGYGVVYGIDCVDLRHYDNRIMVGSAHDLLFSDKSIHTTVMTDVIEHLLPGDDELACREMARVTTHHIFIMANNGPSVRKGEELHVNKRPFSEWDALFKLWFGAATVAMIPTRHQVRNISQLWRIDL